MNDRAPEKKTVGWPVKIAAYAVAAVAVLYAKGWIGGEESGGFEIPDAYAAYEGGPVTLYTNTDRDIGEHLATIAASAWADAAALIGATPDAPGRVFVAKTLDDYNQLGFDWLGGDQSSSFYAFTTPWNELGDVDSASVALGEEDLNFAEIRTWHATVEQFLVRLRGSAGKPLPTWLLNGIAGYLSRFEDAELFEWSQVRLADLDRTFDATKFFGDYRPDEVSIITAGAVVAFLESDAASDDARAAWRAALDAVRGGDGEAAFAELTRVLANEQDAFLAFARS